MKNNNTATSVGLSVTIDKVSAALLANRNKSMSTNNGRNHLFLVSCKYTDCYNLLLGILFDEN